ncbi:1-deoxy-D-xylulose-5-phosphate reductoisomerase [Leekyejoonella antrihumi]|uniref:1-deoxy-D-xylulose 5-phosphate reductoisomerase n=1 Tax=Leekyejoonella antrihumi TaxID=1660198 RepID=A0A563DWQ5_9MICO|nr:1-deoxy-D-xylulose-5-phosphate reductoisomerase [Leekyejoonella antrihumi]TWP34372.1 1-deoxy-D-xylulose-5-phosphate reductoisomerase [Leekyejoonella antrihumi]
MTTTSSPRTVSLLGSTGSIGTQAIQIVTASPDRFRVVGVSAGGRDPRQVAQQAVTLRVEQVAVASGSAAELRELIGDAARSAGLTAYDPEILVGADASERVAASGADVVLNGITGSIGLRPTLAALKHGSTLALANKESLIVGGPIVKALARPGQIVPVDSEHSAIAQCLRVGRPEDVRKLVVTASGGPFRGRSRAELRDVSPQQALAHPTWTMGRMVTTNSATLVNKGLEVIEAHLLFDVPFERIEVVVHPQSIVHSMVQYVDGSTIVQASPPSMLIPIALGLDWPNRVQDAAPAMDWTTASTWEFEPLDDAAFPAVALARQVGQAGSTYPAVYNAANEECVEAFHQERIGFLDIVDTVRAVVDEHDAAPHTDLTVEQVLAAEGWARSRAQQMLSQA